METACLWVSPSIHSLVYLFRRLKWGNSRQAESECPGIDLLSQGLWRDHSRGVSLSYPAISICEMGDKRLRISFWKRGERAALAKGTMHLVKYRLVERWIKLGWAEVL